MVAVRAILSKRSLTNTRHVLRLLEGVHARRENLEEEQALLTSSAYCTLQPVALTRACHVASQTGLYTLVAGTRSDSRSILEPGSCSRGAVQERSDTLLPLQDTCIGTPGNRHRQFACSCLLGIPVFKHRTERRASREHRGSSVDGGG